METKQASSSSKASSATSRLPAVARIQRLALLGPPYLLSREEENTYNELFARISAAVKPFDVIEEIFVADIASCQWEIMELRRVQAAARRADARFALASFLFKRMKLGLLEKDLDREIIKALDKKKREIAEGLLRRNTAEATEQLHQLLGKERFQRQTRLKHRMADDLARSFILGETFAVEEVNRHVACQGETVSDIIDRSQTCFMDTIERLNRLIGGAESVRNASLRELERRRARLGAALRRTLEAEDATSEAQRR